MYGQIGLELLARGMTPQQALDYMLRADEGRNNRQVSILDLQGRPSSEVPHCSLRVRVRVRVAEPIASTGRHARTQ